LIDEQGYRPNVGIIIVNDEKQVLLAQRRYPRSAWQFPQGGIKPGESPLQGMYRELEEELGLKSDQVEVLAESKEWYSYLLPEEFVRSWSEPVCIGQKQKWFLLNKLVSDSVVNLSASPKPEFKHWDWVDYWVPYQRVVDFKQAVYKQILTEFASLVGVAS
jgi:putative (di)nucleoside polyphosphate hydrolase